MHKSQAFAQSVLSDLQERGLTHTWVITHIDARNASNLIEWKIRLYKLFILGNTSLNKQHFNFSDISYAFEHTYMRMCNNLRPLVFANSRYMMHS